MTDEELRPILEMFIQRHKDAELRIEAMRLLCETRGVFTQDEFLAAVEQVRAIWDHEADLTRHRASAESLRALLEKHEGESQ